MATTNVANQDEYGLGIVHNLSRDRKAWRSLVHNAIDIKYRSTELKEFQSQPSHL